MLKDRANESLMMLHTSRLNKYADVIGISSEKAVVRLIHLHRQGVNIAEHISNIIGANHTDYMNKLKSLGEKNKFIR